MLTKYYLLVYVEFAKVGINIKEHKEHIHNGSRKTNIYMCINFLLNVRGSIKH